MLNEVPAGAEGEMLNEAIAPPEELIVNPESWLETFTTSEVRESENCGAARSGAVTVRLKVAVALPAAFVAVIV